MGWVWGLIDASTLEVCIGYHVIAVMANPQRTVGTVVCGVAKSQNPKTSVLCFRTTVLKILVPKESILRL